MAGHGYGSRDHELISQPLCCAVTFLILATLITVPILIVWLIVHPATLVYTVEDAQVYGLNVTEDTLNATFNLTIRATNRNRKASVHYDSIEVTVLYSDQTVATAKIQPFVQPRHSVRMLNVAAVARSQPLPRPAASSLKHDESVGMAKFEVMVWARTRLMEGIVKSKHYTLKIDCKHVVVHFSSPVPFDRTDCDVDT